MQSAKVTKECASYKEDNENYKNTPVLRPKENSSNSILNSPINLYKLGKEEDSIFYNSDEECGQIKMKVCNKLDMDSCVRKSERMKSMKTTKQMMSNHKEENKTDKVINFEGSFSIFDFMSRNNRDLELVIDMDID
jgi:hypothetical protein